MSEQQQPRLTPRGHHHVEAFCLMWYACGHCGHAERIWNSRDGVTPFGTQCPSCGPSQNAGSVLKHVAWNLDEYAPNHKPHRWQKFWRDGTPDEAEAFMRQRIARFRGTQYERSAEASAELIRQARAGEIHEFQQGWPMLDIQLGEKS